MARPRTRREDLDAAWVSLPNGKVRAICPTCLSRPSLDARNALIASGKKGWRLQLEEVQIGREQVTTTVSKYPCSNPDCLTNIIIRHYLAERSDIAPWVKKNTLKAAEQRRYFDGVTGEDQIWREHEAAPSRRHRPAPVVEEPRRRKKKEEVVVEPPKKSAGAAKPAAKKAAKKGARKAARVRR